MVIFSILISGLVFWLQKNQKTSNDLIRFSAENGKEFINVKPKEFLHIKSSGNYIEIFYQSKDEVKKVLIRSSLKVVEELFPDHRNIRRSHRSYLVNPVQIKSIIRRKGKAELDLGSAVIPVSEKYESQFINE